MRLIDVDVFKEKLLKERDAIPLTRKERYGFGVELPNHHGMSMRGGIRKALRCAEETPTADAVLVVHGRWMINPESEDGYKHHMCSKCKTDAPFHYTFADDYDEGLDGEWFYLGQREDGIVEHMGNYCPHCGADMRGE